MKRLAYSLITASLAAASPAVVSAQTVQPDVAIPANHSVLSVTGEGKSAREPDLAVFSAGVTTQGATAGEALSANSRAMERVMAALKRAGIADRDIQTSNLSISPVYRDPHREAAMASRMRGEPYVPPPPEAQIPTIIGYTANNTVSVRQRRLGDYGTIIDTLASAGANQINGPSFQLDKPQPALDEARRDAMADARRKAALYASAAGLRVVRIVSIAEGGGYYGPPPQVRFREAMLTSAPPPPPPPPAPVQPGEMEMAATVAVVFELAP
jgi:uncharacterized protein